MKRLFIAADISDEARRIAAEQIRMLKDVSPERGVSWTRSENLHVTIKFLGDTDEALIPKITETVQNIAEGFRSFTLELSAPEILGKRVISISINDPSRTIFDLEKRIDTECTKLGFSSENRSFHPHLTLARIRDPKSTNDLIRRHRQTQIDPVSFEVRQIVLYESGLRSTGSVYTKLREFRLDPQESLIADITDH